MKFVIPFLMFCSSVSVAAPLPQYQVNMRVGMKGSAPLSINTPIKAGKKASVTELSADGLTETSVVMSARKSQVDKKSGLMMDVHVMKRVKGQTKYDQKTTIFAPENEEREIGKQASVLSLAVVVHQL